MTARVLVVDDVRSNIKLLETRLGLEYFEVLTATNGPDAIAICERGGCDIVLLDVKMPGMDGFEVCRRLRTLPATAHLPIVLLTALDRPADRVRGLESGADDFLTKPVDELALIARVRSLARLKFSIDELRMRAAYSVAAELEPAAVLDVDASERGRLLVVDEKRSSCESWNGAQLYRRADRALYLSKSTGRNRVSADAQSEASSALGLEGVAIGCPALLSTRSGKPDSSATFRETGQQRVQLRS